MTSPLPPAYCCATAAFEGDTAHVLTCPEALARQPQREVLFDLAASPDVSGHSRTPALTPLAGPTRTGGDRDA